MSEIAETTIDATEATEVIETIETMIDDAKAIGSLIEVLDAIEACTEVISTEAVDSPQLLDREGNVIVPGTIKYMGPDRNLAGVDVPIFTPSEVRIVRDQLGISRPGLIVLSGLNGYRCWAAEQETKVDERDAIEWRIRITEVLLKANQEGVPTEAKAKNRKAAAKVQDTADSHVVGELTMLLALAVQGLKDITAVKSLKDAKAKAEALIELLTPSENEETAEVEPQMEEQGTETA